MNDIQRIKKLADKLDLEKYKDDVNRFLDLMDELHPNGFSLIEGMNSSKGNTMIKLPIIIPTFLNEMTLKYKNPDIALAIFYRIKDDYLNKK